MKPFEDQIKAGVQSLDNFAITLRFITPNSVEINGERFIRDVGNTVYPEIYLEGEEGTEDVRIYGSRFLDIYENIFKVVNSGNGNYHTGYIVMKCQGEKLASHDFTIEDIKTTFVAFLVNNPVWGRLLELNAPCGPATPNDEVTTQVT